MLIKDYYLDLDKMKDLQDPEERRIIHNYYKDMLYASAENRDDMAESILNTLFNSGYLKNQKTEKRNKTIDDLTNEG